MRAPHPPAESASPPGLDLDRFAAYLDRAAPGIISGPCAAEVIAGAGRP